MNNSTKAQITNQLLSTFTKTFRQATLAVATVAVVGLVTAQASFAAAIRGGLFNSNILPRNDDGSTGSVTLPFNVNFYGQNFSSLFVNNNGNVTFDAPLSTFTPFNLTSTARQIIAPFFADVDTRNSASGVVTYGNGTVGGRQAFGVNWSPVGYFSAAANRLNDFQLVMVDRSDTGAGNFDFEFNYDRIQWETGSASGGSGGLGGSSARAGFSNGTGVPGTFYELPGSAINGAFLDGGANALISNRLNSNVDGRYLFQVRNGRVDVSVPEPSTMLGLLGFGVLGLGSALKRKQQKSISNN